MSEFIGATALKELQAWQTVLFQTWATDREWASFHRNHYDWWAFPIDKPSSFGFKYTVSVDSISELKQDDQFLGSLAVASKLLLKSWGWNTATGELLLHRDPDQAWANWPIRLSKCNRSLKLFGLVDMANKTAGYASWLKQNGESFYYNGEDLYPRIKDENV